MDKQELLKYLDRIPLTGPGGMDKLKKVILEIIEGGDGSGDVTEEELQEALADKQDLLVSGESIKTINNISVLGTGNIVIPKGEDGQDGAPGSAGPQGPEGPQGPQGIQGNTGSSVAYPFELVNNRTTNDPEKALSAAEGYRIGEDITQLEAKLNNLANTRYYGIFTSSADLPADASENGYAYVGSSTPLAIYEFDGEDWNDTGVTVSSIQGEPGVGFDSVSSNEDGTLVITLSNGDTVTIDLNHNHTQYYSKAVETSQPAGGFLPDIVYNLGTLTGTVIFTLAPTVSGNLNHYFWMFDTSETAPSVTFPNGITWATVYAPTVAANKHYEISILGGIAYYSEV